MWKSKSEKNGLRKKRNDAFCPFIGSPTEECYCVEMSSSSIPLAIQYCQDQYPRCPIYRRIIASEANANGRNLVLPQEHQTKRRQT